MNRKSEIRRGFSMIELLIVVAISMLLIAIAIPYVQPMLANNRLREASRQVNTFIVGAKARAAETGRPFGVRLIRSSVDGTGDPNECYRLQYVEVPPAYCGDIDNALITVGPKPDTITSTISAANPYVVFATSPLRFKAVLAQNAMNPALDQSLNAVLLTQSANQFVVMGSETTQEAWDRANRNAMISPGDFIRFGFQGVSYLICDMYPDTVTGAPTLTLAAVEGAGGLPGGINYSHWPNNPSIGVNQPYSTPQVKTFQILRKPRVAGSATLELPRDTSIDLSMSGLTIGGNEFFAGYDPVDVYNKSQSIDTYNATYADPAPVDIVFDPSGQLKTIVNRGIVQPVNGTIYLMLAKTEFVYSGVGSRGGPPILTTNVPGPELGLSQNLASNDVFWVAIQYPTGTVLTAENIGSHGGSLTVARDLIRSGISTGSR